MQAQESASALNKAGFENVFVLKEGIAGGAAKTSLWYADKLNPRGDAAASSFTPDVRLRVKP